MEKKDEKFVGTAVVILNKKKNKVLFGKRINCFASGTYGVPGGRTHEDEKLIDSAKRELKEETGLISKNIRYLGVVRDVYFDHTFVHFAFLCSQYEGSVKTMEKDKCAGWKWYSFKKLPKNTFPPHKKAVEIFLSLQKENLEEIFNKGKLKYKHANKTN